MTNKEKLRNSIRWLCEQVQDEAVLHRVMHLLDIQLAKESGSK